MFETRAAQESLLRWIGYPKPDYYTYLREHWRRNIFTRQKAIADFDAFWDRSLQDGVVTLAATQSAHIRAFHGDWKNAVRLIAEQNQQMPSTQGDVYELHFYESVALRDGRHANNPWLQELPDPISKVTWGNYAAVAPKLAEKLGVGDGDVLKLTVNGRQVELPAFIQPGQEGRTISIALGYGRSRVGRAGQDIGINVFPLTSIEDGQRQYSAA